MILVVRVSYGEKIRVSSSEKTFSNNFFHCFSGFVSTRVNNFCDNTPAQPAPFWHAIYDQPTVTQKKQSCVVNRIEKTGTTGIFFRLCTVPFQIFFQSLPPDAQMYRCVVPLFVPPTFQTSAESAYSI